MYLKHLAALAVFTALCTGILRAEPREPGWDVLPHAPLFAPLRADPRWPRIGGSWDVYKGDPRWERVGSVDLGTHIPLLQHVGERGTMWEFGLQGAVFMVFDMDEYSTPLINLDPIGALTLTRSRESVSTIVRVYHGSPHLGDEFIILNEGDGRVNISYEAWDILFGWQANDWLRLYGGAGTIFAQQRLGRDPGFTHIGAEMSARSLFGARVVRPLLAIDVQNRQDNDWEGDVSVRAGMAFGQPSPDHHEVLIFTEYYSGLNYNGQFYTEPLQYFGLGLTIHPF